MIAFLGVFVICEAATYYYNKLKTMQKTKINSLFAFFFALIAIGTMSIFFAIRQDSVGVDTEAYRKMYDYLGKDLFSSKIFTYEFLYCLVNVLSNIFFNNFNMCMLIVGLITFTNIFISVNKLSKHPSTSIAIFIGLGMYAQSFNAVRQYVALSFIMVGLIFLLNKNSNLLFILFVLIATLFHKSAFISAGFLVLKYIKFNHFSIPIISILCVLSVFMFPYIGKFVDFALNTYYYEAYSKWTTESLDIQHSLALLIYVIILGLLVYFKIKLKDVMTKSERKKYDFFSIMFMGFIFFEVLSFFTTEVIARLGIYCLISVMFLPPIILKYMKPPYKAIFTILLHLALIAFMSIILGYLKLYEVVPYITIFK